MGPQEFCLAVMALLFTPGPTNTLLALAGAGHGHHGGARHVLAELAGYMTLVLPLWWLGTALLRAYPDFGTGLRIVAALWLAVIAARLWGAQRDEVVGQEITPFSIFVTTMLNPKGLVFGLVLMPLVTFPPVTALAVLAGLILTAGCTWFHLGRLVVKAGRALTAGQPVIRLLRRMAAVWLAIVSGGLAFSVITG